MLMHKIKPNKKPIKKPVKRSKVEAPRASRLVLTQMLIHLIRKHFYLFCVYYDPEFFCEDRPHLQTIAEAFQRITDKKTNKLAISMPPRAGKSYTTSLWSAWMIGRGSLDSIKLDTSIMRNSYGGDLAEKFSYDVRDIVQSDRYKAVFPMVRLKKDHSRIEDWAIVGAVQSSYFCAGVGGGITGKGCKTAAIADDLIKNLEDGLSETVLTKTWNWYTSTHLSRMEAGCPEIHIATRWSKNDPVGKSLEAQPGLWDIVVIPALTADNRSFCEKVKTTAEYLEMKRIVDELIWEAEFMQNPIEAKGLLYPKDSLHWFTLKELAKYFDSKCPEEFDAAFGYTDTADEGTDYLASGTVKVIGNRYYLTDVIFTQDTIEITQPLVAGQIVRNDEQVHQVESNNGGKGFALKVRELVQATDCLCTIKWVPNTTNKVTRILMSSGEVKEFLWFRSDCESGSDYDKFIKNVTGYVKMGKNVHDDGPDLLAGIVGMIAHPGMRLLSTKHK